jgi:hypothetical protein
MVSMGMSHDVIAACRCAIINWFDMSITRSEKREHLKKELENHNDCQGACTSPK